MNHDLIALVDCNSFFCSCERVFKPHLAQKPVIVLSNNDGCVVARTDESKKLGIAMGVPYFQIKDFCKKNKVSVFSSNFPLYGDISSRVMRTLQEFTDEMEVYSIDESFLSIKGLNDQQVLEWAQKVKKTVYQNVGIPVSIGIASTKVLAKLANSYAKDHKLQTQGIYYLNPAHNHDSFLQQHTVMDIWGISSKIGARLAQHNIFTAKEFKYADSRLIKKSLTITGWRLHEEINGRSTLDLETAPEDRKHIMSTRSFGRDVEKLDDLKEAVANHVSNAAEKLRRQNCVTKNITVYIRTNRHNENYYYNSASVELTSASSVTNKLIKHAFEALEKIYKPGYKYKKAGVFFYDFYKKDQMQMDLFGSSDTETEQNLMSTIDTINRKKGKNTVKYAALGIDQFWKMLSQMKSPNYTTSWRDLPKID